MSNIMKSFFKRSHNVVMRLVCSFNINGAYEHFLGHISNACSLHHHYRIDQWGYDSFKLFLHI